MTQSQTTPVLLQPSSSDTTRLLQSRATTLAPPASSSHALGSRFHVSAPEFPSVSNASSTSAALADSEQTIKSTDAVADAIVIESEDKVLLQPVAQRVAGRMSLNSSSSSPSPARAGELRRTRSDIATGPDLNALISKHSRVYAQKTVLLPAAQMLAGAEPMLQHAILPEHAAVILHNLMSFGARTLSDLDPILYKFSQTRWTSDFTNRVFVSLIKLVADEGNLSQLQSLSKLVDTPQA
ncbi:hypothetical protein CAOG_03010 [Capsaspora owczarzaki ATCC 30864]|uniref:Uncharacterized protein n=1 Tax=Capsaspora owczarzaki (strain ATCC 30864) TaxID=595528 RepID=A0A0D2VNP2_CAPO3|nr:hypothetical protein CAOG_03010 [Capsaspora owczarzaki ATCC 30864]KJE91967.1 hypothetical protein CAOG_003010 [Capsaspora owczarzaki ATCC 30864]|eukprot:XP_004363849.1 hypothetical protein CAOG_03010 [Capsaspora owczarzaki ATCC 30864]